MGYGWPQYGSCPSRSPVEPSAHERTGGGVTIPSFLIGKQDGIAIKEAIHEKEASKIGEDQDDWDDGSDDAARRNKRRSRNWAGAGADRSRE